MLRTLALAAVIALLAIPPAAADHDRTVTVADQYYVVFDDDLILDGTWYPCPTVWQETNGLDGLQRTETTLPNGTVVPADTRVADPSEDPGLPGVNDNRLCTTIKWW